MPARLRDPYCNYCEVGLASCDVCGGAEGSLPTDCPGRRMTQYELSFVFVGELDFKDGSWKVMEES